MVSDLGSGERQSLLTRPFLVVTGAALVFFVYIGMLIPIVPLFIEGPLDAGEFGIGMTIAVFALAAIMARPLLGRLADRYGRRAQRHRLEPGVGVLAAAGPARPHRDRRGRDVRRRGDADRRHVAA
jgi:MFS family permease